MLDLNIKLVFIQIHSDFIGTCFQRMKVIYQSLCQYKPGEIESETEDLQMAYNNEARSNHIDYCDWIICTIHY